MVVVGLERAPGSASDRCKHFLSCLYDRLFGETDARTIDLAVPQLPFMEEDDFAAAKQQVIAAASECDRNWHELYRFPPE